jgi:uncharacterized OB-fold protein
MTGVKPAPDRTLLELAPYWDGLDRGLLLIPRCEGCGRFRWPPRPRCAACGGTQFAWTEARPEATLYSWTTVGRAFLPGFADDVPYTVAVVELTEATPIRMVGRLIGVHATEVEAGMRLAAAYQEEEGRTLCYWGPAGPR